MLGRGGRARTEGDRARRRRDPRAHERQPLPLRRLREHRRRRSPTSAPMRPFAYERAADADAAVGAGRRAARRYLAGGTNLVDLMKLGVATPERLVDVTRAARSTRSRRCRRRRPADRRRACATATSPPHPAVRERYPVLVAGAAGRRLGPAAQPRHRRRQPAAAHALLVLPGRHEAVQQARARAPAARRARASTATSRSSGTREHCVATHPSDMAVALAALGAVVHVQRHRRRAHVPMPGLHRLPGDEPERDTVLEPGELITAVELPRARRSRRRSRYRKVRDRASFAFALVSVAAALDVARRRRRRRAGSRSAASPTRRGAPSAPRRRCAARPPTEAELRRAPPTPSWPQARAAARQRLQGAARAQRARRARSRELCAMTGTALTPRRRRARSSRVEGREKVTGAGALRLRAAGRGRRLRGGSSQSTDRQRARSRARRRRARRSRIPGVLAVLSHENAPRLADGRRRRAARSSSRRDVAYRGQIVAAVSPRRSRPRARRAGRRARRLRRRRRTTSRCAPTTRASTRPRRSTRASRPTPRTATSTPALRRRRGRGRRDLHDAGRSTTTRWSRTRRSPSGRAAG